MNRIRNSMGNRPGAGRRRAGPWRKVTDGTARSTRLPGIVQVEPEAAKGPIVARGRKGRQPKDSANINRAALEDVGGRTGNCLNDPARVADAQRGTPVVVPPGHGVENRGGHHGKIADCTNPEPPPLGAGKEVTNAVTEKVDGTPGGRFRCFARAVAFCKSSHVSGGP